MAADERVTGFVERLVEKWARIAEQEACDHEPTVCREWAQDSIRRALREALTEAARVVRNKNTSAFDEAADEIERLASSHSSGGSVPGLFLIDRHADALRLAEEALEKALHAFVGPSAIDEPEHRSTCPKCRALAAIRAAREGKNG